VLRVHEWIEQNHARRIEVSDIARASGMSLRNPSRRLQTATGLAPSDYLRVRLEAAKRLLDASDLAQNEIANEVGYGDPRAFSRGSASASASHQAHNVGASGPSGPQGIDWAAWPLRHRNFRWSALTPGCACVAAVTRPRAMSARQLGHSTAGTADAKGRAPSKETVYG